jgi:hypothetical protein
MLGCLPGWQREFAARLMGPNLQSRFWHKHVQSGNTSLKQKVERSLLAGHQMRNQGQQSCQLVQTRGSKFVVEKNHVFHDLFCR